MTGTSMLSGFKSIANKARKAALPAVFVTSILSAPALASNDPAAATESESTERLRIVVSLSEQRADLYRGRELVETSRVSTGRKGYSTPAGVYSILQKNRHHRSNIYSGAPMPYMQRITWSGIALHEGNVSRPYASHGCIRLPRKFARKLFSMTEIGADVIVVNEEAAPLAISHPALFQPTGRDRFALAPLSDADSQTAAIALADIEAAFEQAQADAELTDSPLRILITRRTGRERVKDLQRMLAELGHEPGEIDGYMGSATGKAIQSFQTENGQPATGMLSEELYADLYKAVGREEASGHVYVRQDYVDVFDAPAIIRGDDAPLGTHLFTSAEFTETTKQIDWQVLTLKDAEGAAPSAILDRVEIPEHIRKRIERVITPGTTFIVSDAGLGRETGKGTDFIVQPSR